MSLLKQQKKIVGLSLVDDYIFRPRELESMCLYDWRRCCKRLKLPHTKKKQSEADEDVDILDANVNENDNFASDEDDNEEGNEVDHPCDNRATADNSLPKSMYRFFFGKSPSVQHPWLCYKT